MDVSLEAGAIVAVLSAVAEFLYHMNIKTPHWIGYIFQRPEMHRIHHQRSKHYNNFSDLPMWDMMFGTFENPKSQNEKCGFKVKREQQFLKICLFKNVNNNIPECHSSRIAFLKCYQP